MNNLEKIILIIIFIFGLLLLIFDLVFSFVNVCEKNVCKKVRAIEIFPSLIK